MIRIFLNHINYFKRSIIKLRAEYGQRYHRNNLKIETIINDNKCYYTDFEKDSERSDRNLLVLQRYGFFFTENNFGIF